MLNKRYIFFRDDDVCSWDESFSVLFDLFLTERVPVVYGVIPGRASKNFLASLRKKRKESRGIFDLVQHGWTHHNYGGCEKEVRYQIAPGHYRIGSNKYEFGPGRSINQQKNDIVSGWLKLSYRLRESFTPAFIPPFHAYDINTLKIINELGAKDNLKIFSAGKKTFPKKKNFLDIPAELLFAPPASKKDDYLKSFLGELENKFRSQTVAGILLHHGTYDAEDLSLLKNLLRSIKKNKAYEFLLFSDLIKDKRNTKLSLVLETTNACNLSCKICNIWQEKPVRHLRLSEIRTAVEKLLAQQSIGAVSLTGGEAFLNPEIDRIFDYFAALKARGLIDFLGIYSNGYDLDRIMNFLESKNRFLDKNMELGISLDGMAHVHNILRGRKDAFSRTARLIKNVRTRYPVLRLAVKYTISPLNIGSITKVYDFCRRHGLRLLPKFMEVGNRYYYHRKPRTSSFSKSWLKDNGQAILLQLRHIRSLEKRKKNKIIEPAILDALINVLENEHLSCQQCYTPLYSLFISAWGDIHPCLCLPAVSNIKKRRWDTYIMNSGHLKIAIDAVRGACPGCLAYHGFLKNINLF